MNRYDDECMTCAQVQVALDAHFDAGDSMDASLQTHLDACPACETYRVQLEGLNDLLCVPSVLEEDTDLIARIQTAVSRPQSFVVPMWGRVAVALVVIGASLAGGWVIDRYAQVPETTMTAWWPSEPLLPDWTLFRAELEALPAQVRLETVDAAASVSEAWNGAGSFWTSLLQGNGLILGATCIAGLALVVMMDTREARRAT